MNIQILKWDTSNLAYLFKLVDTEDTPSVLAVRSCLFAVACAVTGISVFSFSDATITRKYGVLLDRKVLILQPLAIVQGRQWLFRSGNEVLVGGFVLTLSDLVQLLVELLQLRSLCHEVPKHELWGLVGLVAFVEEELQAVVNQSQIEE
jgi:hypothetical protein